MYRPGGDMPQFRPVPAAPPPPRMMPPPFISPPPSIPPAGHPPVHGPMQGRPPVMQQYMYPPPAPQLPPPLLVPPPRGPPPSMHPSMQPSLPAMQRPLPTMQSNMPPSLHSVHPPRPLLQPPPPPLQASFASMQPSLPSVRPISTPFQPPLMQVQPPPSFVPAPLRSIQPPPFLPPLPASPPLENPPPPPPPSPPPQPPPLPLTVESLSSSAADLLPPEPPKPTDPEMLKNIDVLAAFVAKNGPRFESMARARQAGDPKFAFLFESDASPEAAIGHEFYKWKKQSFAMELGLESENKKNIPVDSGAASGRFLHVKATPGQTLLRDVFPASPTMSDMDMEDDFIPSPARQPAGHLESTNLDAKARENIKVPPMKSETTQKNAQVSMFESTSNMPTMHDSDGSSKGAFQEGTSQNEALLVSLDGRNLETVESSSRSQISNSMNVDEHRQIDGNSVSIKDGADRGLEQSKSLERLSDLNSGNTGLEPQRKLEVTDVSLDVNLQRPERRMGRLSRWESVPISQSNAAVDASKHDSLPHNQDGGRQKSEEPSSSRHDSATNDFVDRVISSDMASEENFGNGRPTDTVLLEPNQEAVSVDEFGRLVRKETMESESDDDTRPRKRRRSYSRSRSPSRSRGRGKSRSRSRSRSRGRSRSRSRSLSYSSGGSRWRRQSFSRSPRRGRRSRSRSHSPGHWQRNDSRSPSRDMRWGGMGRGDRDWRGERESYGRGRRAGRGSGPSICFHFARGRCFRGAACKFLHPEREMGQGRGMLSTAPGFKDAEPGQEVFPARKSLIGADPHVDQVHGGSKDEQGAGRTESDREIETFSKAVDLMQSNGGRSLSWGLGSASAVVDNSAQAATAARTQASSEAARYAAKASLIGNMESVENLPVDEGVDTDTVGTVGVTVEIDGSKKTALDEAAAKSDNREIRSIAENLEIHESLKMIESTRKDVDEKVDTSGVEKLVDGVSQVIRGSEHESDTMNTRVQHKDILEGVNPPHHEPSEMVLHEKKSPIIDRGKFVAIASKSDLVLASEMLESEHITRKGSAELATAKSDVGLEAPGGPELSKKPLSGSLSPVPVSQTNLMGNSVHMASASNNSSEQRHGPVSGQHPSPAAKRSSPQSQPLTSPVPNVFPNTSSSYSVGSFNPSNLLSSQATTSVSANVGTHHPFPVNNSQRAPNLHDSLHGTLRIQPSHGASFPPHLGFSQNKSQQSLLRPQDHLPNFTTNHPGKFSLNPSIVQGHGVRPFSVKERQEWSGSFSSSIEDSTYARLFGDSERQYIHSNPSSDVLQHAYPRPGIVASSASINTPLAWKDESLAKSRSMLVSSAEQPHYSYTLTTIPPLPNIIKLPGSSSLAGSGEQYDPLSDVLDLGPSGALKSLSSKPPGDGRPVGVGFLENVSPGLDPEKVSTSGPKLEVDNVNTNEAAADVGVVENVSPPGDWSPVQPGDASIMSHDQLHSKSKKTSRGLKLLRTAVADRVKALLKPSWKEGRLSKDAFKTIAKKAVEKVTGNLPSHHIPKSQEKVDQFMSVSSSKISKLVQGYVDKYSKVQS